MRIIGGDNRGYKIQRPKTDGTRPISEQAREALFNILGDVSDLSFLDAYAGSGSVGLEALSRGATSVVAIDNSREAAVTISANAEHLGTAKRLILRQMAVESWLVGSNDSFDVVFADPPFTDINAAPLQQLADRAKRVFAYKHPRRTDAISIEGFKLRKSRRYGDSNISVYTRP